MYALNRSILPQKRFEWLPGSPALNDFIEEAKNIFKPCKHY